MNTVTQWLLAASVRALKTAAQAALGIIGATALITDVNWIVVFSGAAMAAVISLLMSIAGIGEVSGGDSLPKIVSAYKEEGE